MSSGKNPMLRVACCISVSKTHFELRLIRSGELSVVLITVGGLIGNVNQKVLAKKFCGFGKA